MSKANPGGNPLVSKFVYRPFQHVCQFCCTTIIHRSVDHVNAIGHKFCIRQTVHKGNLCVVAMNCGRHNVVILIRIRLNRKFQRIRHGVEFFCVYGFRADLDVVSMVATVLVVRIPQREPHVLNRRAFLPGISCASAACSPDWESLLCCRSACPPPQGRKTPAPGRVQGDGFTSSAARSASPGWR